MEKLKNYLSTIKDVTFSENISLAKYSTFKLQSIGNLLVIRTIESCKDVVKFLNHNKIPYNIIGWGANTIISPNPDQIFLKLDFDFDRSLFDKPREHYDLPASVGLNLLTSHAVKFGLKGWEVFTGIPGTIGGAIFMNAGTNLGEFGNLVEWVSVLRKSGEIECVYVSPESFGYRHNRFISPGDVILGARIKNLGLDQDVIKLIQDYLKYRMNTQPLSAFTCGCVFQNHDAILRAGKSLDLLGLKGVEVGGIRVSRIHANFMENFSNGTYNDFVELVELVSEELYLNFGIRFPLEVQIPNVKYISSGHGFPWCNDLPGA